MGKLRGNKKCPKLLTGFTLIELLVVISIISLLSSVVFASVNSARAKARDAKRSSDLSQIQLALNLFYDTNNRYPGVSDGVNGWIYSSDASWNTLQTALAPYIPLLPKDPINNAANPWSTGNYSYSYGWNIGAGSCPGYPSGDCSGQSYDLVAQLEDTNNPNRCALKSWRIHTYSPGEVWCGTFSPYLYADH